VLRREEQGSMRSPANEAAGAAARRYLIEFARMGPGRYLSHLDTARAVQRTFARAGFSLALTRGMRPKARLALGLPLPVGAEGLSELAVADVEDVDGEMLAGEATQALQAAAPPGLRIVALEPCRPHLRLRPRLALYEWRVDVPGDELVAAARRFVGETQVPVARRSPKGRRELDLRRYVDAVEVEPDGDGARVRFAVRHRHDGAARPAEVLAQLLAWSGADEFAGAERYRLPSAPIDEEADERFTGATADPAAGAAGESPARIVDASLTRLGVVYDGLAIRGPAQEWLERHASQTQEERGPAG
jgi:radical SAM-linked protein